MFYLCFPFRSKMPPLRYATSLLLLSIMFLSWRICHGRKILIVPLEGSHWVNMDIMIKALHSRGHSIDVVRTSKSWYIQDDSPCYKTITVPISEAFNHDFINPILKKVIDIERGESSVLSFASLQAEMFSAMFNMHRIMCKMATNMFEDEDLMNTLKDRKYDLVLTDPAWGAGIMLAHALKLPLVYNVRWITSGEGHMAIAPSPLSYVPLTGSGLSDKMTFIQRVKNHLFSLIWQAQDGFFIHPQYQAVCDQFFGPEVRYIDLLQGADLWLMRVDFVFEFPRPTIWQHHAAVTARIPNDGTFDGEGCLHPGDIKRLHLEDGLIPPQLKAQLLKYLQGDNWLCGKKDKMSGEK
ncbi:UDP-glucuronosyltransferase 1-5-like [Anarrhichthys ocellatus]|uniref:UDP-glucuronosyltransferase 1-5-like n=1 Tax=Anarrhichthys ocellatus TaxID=433405 RepID=UPI0012EE8DF9|nr:UDP-glucuronosyltransferase 1-5-like [Anarrhichthys ocellatus]